MRHTVEVICESRGKRLYKFNLGILFNRISPERCIQLNHSNFRGVVRMSNGPIKLTCSGVPLSFTRDKMHKFFRTRRCSQMRSCAQGMCNKIYSNGTVPELRMASMYPGYITYDQTCGGIACGCFLPMPACSFLLLAEIPKSQSVYEVVRCMKDRLLTESEALALPEDCSLSEECDPRTQAEEECVKRMFCVRENLKAARACECPQDSIRNLRKDVTNAFPIKTPFTEIRAGKEDIDAYSHEVEITIVLKSNSMINSSNYTIEQPCDIAFEGIRGCYNCSEGEQVNMSCKTDFPAWETVECDSQVFSIQRDSSNKSNLVSLEFIDALVQEKCHILCCGRRIMFDSRGALV
ncbi:hypothetical protein ANCCEY_07450 [Ancylostoma ceylanicum]|uniref:Phlebovirus glycoprotein G2 fusion domain-containing protein n=1 Tax=Ancylostoma ceylanicum TaxID=53326 RepID=A0A0D6LTU2_9BILA|nr:hypothetical protein ANCCEY_07450 [Ancylostoma ceylanicum]